MPASCFLVPVPVKMPNPKRTLSPPSSPPSSPHLCASPNLPNKRPRPTTPTTPSSTPTPSPLSTFSPTPFLPFLSRNPHFQTILPHFHPSPPSFPYTRITLPSDDAHALLHIDLHPSALPLRPLRTPLARVPPFPSVPLPATLPPSPPVALVLHGLESNASALVTRRIVHVLAARAFHVAVLNFRTCASGARDVPSTLRLYHAGFTDDLETALRAFAAAAVADGRRPPDVFLAGFSLGANVLCNFLGKWGPQARQRFRVVAAAGACVPFDPTACQRRLDSGWRGAVYSSRLVSSFHHKFNQAVRMGVDIGDCVPDQIRNADRVGKIDDAFIVPVFGFKDRFDYYHQVDSRKVLNRIAVPTYLINSRDDPFFDHASGRSLPTPEHIGDAPVLLHITEHGGHCGFLDRQAFQQDGTCYFQREFARFFVHVRDAKTKPDDQNNTTPADA